MMRQFNMGSNSSKSKNKNAPSMSQEGNVPAPAGTSQMSFSRQEITTKSSRTETYHRSVSIATDSGVASRLLQDLPGLQVQNQNVANQRLFPHATVSAGSDLARRFDMPEMRHFNNSMMSRPRIRGPLGSIGNNQPDNVLFAAPAPSPRLRHLSETAASSPPPSPRRPPEEEPLINIVINKKPSQGLVQQASSHIPMYNTTGRKRGVSLIINNIEFEKTARSGADIDGRNMFNLLTALKLNPKEKVNMTAREMRMALENYAKNSELKDADMCVIVIMSHGSGTADTMTKIMGIDGEGLKVYEIIRMFSTDNCKYLKNKPKIFLFQCCRGDAIAHDEHDALPTKLPNCGDMLVAYSTVPGYVSVRNTKMGSYYIREICKVFMEHASDTHVEDMLKKVDEHMRKSRAGQLTSFENLSFKNCYFNPIV